MVKKNLNKNNVFFFVKFITIRSAFSWLILNHVIIA